MNRVRRRNRIPWRKVIESIASCQHGNKRETTPSRFEVLSFFLLLCFNLSWQWDSSWKFNRALGLFCWVLLGGVGSRWRHFLRRMTGANPITTRTNSTNQPSSTINTHTHSIETCVCLYVCIYIYIYMCIVSEILKTQKLLATYLRSLAILDGIGPSPRSFSSAGAWNEDQVWVQTSGLHTEWSWWATEDAKSLPIHLYQPKVQNMSITPKITGSHYFPL